VNTSSRRLPTVAHDSGPPWLATPSAWDSFIPSFLPVYPGAFPEFAQSDLIDRGGVAGVSGGGCGAQPSFAISRSAALSVFATSAHRMAPPQRRQHSRSAAKICANNQASDDAVLWVHGHLLREAE